MPQHNQAAELFDRLRAVETAVERHTSECRIRNENRERWEALISDDVTSLKLDRAKFIGIAIAVSTLASALGSGGVLALFRLFSN